MNPYVEKLYGMATRAERVIVGLMSGTSLDGLDIALCRITGSGRRTALQLEHSCTKPYASDFRRQIQDIFAKRAIDQQQLCGLHALIGRTHGALVNEALLGWGIPPEQVDLIASHGQTVFHAPRWLTGDRRFPDSTLQIGDGDHIAAVTGIITISDFRQKHVAGGGEGAPLAVYGDSLLFSHETETRLLLNIGGIANFTFLPASTAGGTGFATDVGPGNTLMNQYMQRHLGAEMDRDARVSSSGTVNQDLLRGLLEHPFFGLPFPKTTGPELFNLEYLHRAQQDSGTVDLEKNDVMATLCAFSAAAITAAIQQVPNGGDPTVRVYVSGGGLHNPLLMQLIRDSLPATPINAFDALGLLPDAKEAALFALLANETVAGSAAEAYPILGAPAVYMGKISFPG
ncbi:anhydro-N-acetylmuramic acid kinase [Parapedobacter lycopersici]|uniref:anhydro-N-acetylmuramic acid kinase n=1 Tax=Parapedobacter lycopersici TaxID=1864939 RepID=UPI00333FE2A5